MTCAVVIVAAGRGLRAGGDGPKQWQGLAGARVIDHTLAVFEAHEGISQIVLVLHPDELNQAPSGPQIVAGGDTRAASVKAGLQALVGTGCTKVLIHDVARPCVTDAILSAVISALDDTPGAAPALPVSDALWTGAEGRVTGTQDRSGLYRAQTPQGFTFDAILAAHAAFSGDAADDVEVARASGLDVAIVPGDEDNLKITYPGDFARAERILEARHGHSSWQRI